MSTRKATPPPQCENRADSDSDDDDFKPITGITSAAICDEESPLDLSPNRQFYQYKILVKAPKVIQNHGLPSYGENFSFYCKSAAVTSFLRIT